MLRIVVIALVILVAVPLAPLVIDMLRGGGGSQDWGSQVTYNSQGDAQLGKLQVGRFNYINACEVFTARDYNEAGGERLEGEFDAIMGQLNATRAPEHDVTATFARRTYGDKDPLRTYKSRCDRGGTRVTIDQFSSKDLQGKIDAFLPGFVPDEELTQALGTPAMYNGQARDIKFDINNKHVFVSCCEDETVEQRVRDAELDLALAVTRNIEKRAGQPSRVLAFSPKPLKIGAFPYHGACSLLTPDLYRKAVGVEPDAAKIETEYLEKVSASDLSAGSSCTMHTLGPGTPPPDSGGSESVVDQVVELRMDQYDSVDHAHDNFSGPEEDDDGTKVRVQGLGDDAYVRRSSGAMGAVQLLHVLQDNVDFSVRIDRFGPGGAPQESDPDSDLELLKDLAKGILRRLG